MNRFFRLWIIGTFALNAATSAGEANSCAMPQSFDDPHPVLHDGTKSLFWVRPMNVDADGTPHAYHRDDPHGKKGLAIEYIGNGMTIKHNGEEIPFAPEEEDNAAWLAAYRRIVANGWKTPPGFSIDIYGFALDKNRNVCVGPGGRLISATSLVINPDAEDCDQKRYVDALRFPGIVVPNRTDEEQSVENSNEEVARPFAKRGVRRGDLAVAYNPETGIWKGAFLYDTGPREKLGEGSIRLVMNLRGTKEEPRSAEATNAMTIPETYVILFPGTVGDLGDEKDWTPERTEAAAAERFKQWGGGSITGALQRLSECAQVYKNQ